MSKLILCDRLIDSVYTLEEFLEFDVRGVTSVISHVLGTDLSHIPPHVLQNAGERGTSIHESIEHYMRTGEIKFFFEYRPWQRGFEMFLYSIETIEPMALELRCVSSSVKGVVDFVGYVDGVLTLIDWKSSSNMSGETRLSAEMQANFYADLLISNYNIDVDKIEVVSIQKDKFKRLTVERDKTLAPSILKVYEHKCKHVKHVRKV